MIYGLQSDKEPIGSFRSGRWPSVRKAHLKLHPFCEVCGGRKKLEVHHIKPFHTHPDLELDSMNLITLCENKADGVNCHLLFGHLGSFKSINPTCPHDATAWRHKIRDRV